MILSSKTKLYIVVPCHATSREIFAAEELKTCLEQIFPGICVVIHDDTIALNGTKIILGGPERNAKTAPYISESKFDALIPGPEGMIIKTFDDDTLLLAGSSKNPNECERGTIFAVYELLERFLGCSLAAYVNPDIAGGAFLPCQVEANLSGIEYIKPAADLKYRTAIVQYADEAGDPVHALNIPFLNWLIRNRYNRILTWSSVYESYKELGMLAEAEKRGIRFTVGHHEAPKLFLPPYGNKYFPEPYEETHPEFYRLEKDGSRFKVTGSYGQWIYCSRNEELIETISNNVISWICQNPSVDIIAFWPQDGTFDSCACDACAKYTKVENYTYFLNAVAKRVSAVHPNVKIDMLVYTDLWDCPNEQTLEPCLLVDEATWHHTGLRKCGKPDGSGIIGTQFEELMRWKAAGAEVVYYDYYMGVYSSRQRWIPIADEIQALCSHFQKNDVYGTGTQIECFNLWNHIFNFYTFARTAYDTSLSMRDNLSRFSRIFGDGAPYIEEIIEYGESLLDGQTTIGYGGKWLMENIDKDKVYALYETALSAAKTPAARNNIRMMRMVFRYSDLEVEERNKYQMAGKYQSLEKYTDDSGELAFLSTFSSFKQNNPGFGIAIPVNCEPKDFVPDQWYAFEKL